MKITAITLYNFTSYQGEHRFDFNDKFNMITGLNGAGKSSLQRAVVWCLFGYKMFDSNFKTKKYDDFVTGALNINSTKNEMFVVVDFKQAENIYQVKRVVNFEGSKYTETTKAVVDNQVVPNIKLLREYSKEMIESFFFDGEVILDYIINDKVSEYIVGLVDISFNLQVFDEISNDLKILAKKNLSPLMSDKLKDYQQQYKNLKSRLNDVENLVKIKRQRYEQNALNIEAINDMMSQNNVISNSDLALLTKANENNKRQMLECQRKFKNFMVTKFNNMLIQDAISQEVKKLDLNRSKRKHDLFAAYDDIINTKLETKIDFSLERKLVVLNNFEFDINSVLGLIDSIDMYNQKDLEFRLKIQKSQEGVKYIDQLDNYEALIDQNSELSEQLNSLDAEIVAYNVEIESVVDKIEDEESVLEKIILDQNSLIQGKVLDKIICEYLEEQNNIVYEKLSKSFVKVYKYISRKSGLIDNITVVSGKLMVSYKDSEVDIKNISSGEKQVLILALLLTIIKEAKVEIPLFLDSLFIRLDSKHTKNILKFISTELESQIILLVTDKEINEKEYKFISSLERNEYVLSSDGNSTAVSRKEIR